MVAGTTCWASEGGDWGAIPDDSRLVSTAVSGEGREARAGEERRRVERWDWVMTEVWG